jgi:hypothetical protein
MSPQCASLSNFCSLNVQGLSLYTFIKSFKCQNARLSSIRFCPVPEKTKLPMPEPVWSQNKGTPSGTGMLLYRTEMTDIGMTMPVPSYAFQVQIVKNSPKDSLGLKDTLSLIEFGFRLGSQYSKRPLIPLRGNF